MHPTENASLKIRIAARDASYSRIGVKINGQSKDNIEISSASSNNPYARVKNSIYSFIPSSTNISVNLTALTSGISTAYYLDYAVFMYSKKLKLNNEGFVFRIKDSIHENSIVDFKIESKSQATVWDVTDVNLPKKIPTTFLNGITTAKVKMDKLKTFVAFDNTFKSPHFEEKVENIDILKEIDCEMLIISHPDFHSAAEKLAEAHLTHDNIKTKIVEQKYIYDLFSSGKADISAIRNYIRYIYDNNSKKLKYVLLLGDGSYDNRDFDKTGKNIITFQSAESLYSYRSFVSDDYFGMLDVGDGVENNGIFEGKLDVAIGRIPVSTVEEAEIVINKTVEYITNPAYRGEWQNNLCFLADDSDENQNFHMTQADELTININKNYPEFNFSKLYLDSYEQEISSAGERYPDAVKALYNIVRKGCLVLNYTGHGSETQLAAENLVDASIVKSWNNKETLPLFITASCEVALYDRDELVSLGEKLLLQEGGGAVALFSTSRVVFADDNFTLNDNIFKKLFSYDEKTGTPLTIGDAFRLGKTITTDNAIYQNKRSFVLLGDPALRLATPEYKIIIDSINGKSVNPFFEDTLKAKSINTIQGHIETNLGTTVTDYNGTVFLRIFDKSQTITTLGNDGNDPIEFESYDNELFHGKASVTKGYFKTSFIVPQDIYYYEGFGKANFYATNNIVTSSGVCDSLKIFGTNLDAEEDTEGPKIEIFMNDTLFRDGQTTHENPKLLVKITDKSGVNISSSSIGHDILVYLDDDEESAIELNDFYIADENTFITGTIEYPFSDLSPGKHTLTIIVWDTYNNVSEKEIEFYVTSKNNIKIKNLFSYPNPIMNSSQKDEITFRFEHNQADQEIEISIKIYNSFGQIVKTISNKDIFASFTNDSISWDCTSDSGSKLGKGIYPYTLTITNKEGQKTFSSQKILVLQ